MRLLRNLMFPTLALLGIGFAIARAQFLTPSSPAPAPRYAPATPDHNGPRVAGLGLTEPPGESVGIGVAKGGLVTQVPVTPGQRVSAGDILLELDDIEAQAAVELRRSELELAEKRVERLAAMPRAESLPPLEQKVAAAAAMLAGARDRLSRTETLVAKNAATPEELQSRRADFDRTQADLAAATAELKLHQAGAWKHDLDVAKAEVQQAKAALRVAEAALARLTIRAPRDLVILRVNVRPGEYVEAERSADAPIVTGPVGPLHVRVEFDEAEGGAIDPAQEAVAVVRSRNSLRLPLRFVRFEPLVRPKKTMTGSSNERVDTRVLVAVYELVQDEPAVFVGQQVDVFAPAKSPR